MTELLDQDIKYLKGVGPHRAKMLESELGVKTLRDFVTTYPYKYIDRTEIHTINDLREDMPYVQICVHITDFSTEGTGSRQRLKALATDGTGYVELVWFQGAKYYERQIKMTERYLVFGKPSWFNGRISVVHPELEVLRPDQAAEGTFGGKLQPHYHTTERMKRASLTSKVLTRLMTEAFTLIKGHDLETLPDYIRSEYHLIDRGEALRRIHFPTSAGELPEASRRLKFDELFYLQLDLLRYVRRRKERGVGTVFAKVGTAFLDFFQNHLPFSLTGAQKRVMHEIRDDLRTGRQMNRLVQGDVGSGKTVVALMTCLLAIDNGYQACLMAPTEILAGQHFATITGLLRDTGIDVRLLTGSVTGKKRKDILEATADGRCQLLVGTHALIEPTVVFQRLGLAIIDEQHRFGVKQRAMLWAKNNIPPHVLVMTATPIPRTLAMTVYGDLDVSVIDELPPGRQPVTTLHYNNSQETTLHDGLLRQLQAGRQVYVVYPLIEESEKSDLQDLMTGFESVSAAFPQYKVGIMHGRMSSTEKDDAMARFSSGETQILVATTVIEVGVNVPNATVMVIENADRFGLSQLHQLRGRVGRGADKSYCILITHNRLSDHTLRRMEIMTETCDGFRIAEEDLRLRGSGDLQGTAQSGMPLDLNIADIVRDAELMAVCREAAMHVVETDPDDCLPQNDIIRRQLKIMTHREDFSGIS